MRTAYCFEHRHLERILRPRDIPWPRLAEGRLIIYHDAQIVVAWMCASWLDFPILWGAVLWLLPNVSGYIQPGSWFLRWDVALDIA